MDENRIAQIASYNGITADAVRGFIVDMVATGAAPDAESALNAVNVILDGVGAYERILMGPDASVVSGRLEWDRGTDRLVENVLTEAWAATRDLPAPDGYQGKHR